MLERQMLALAPLLETACSSRSALVPLSWPCSVIRSECPMPWAGSSLTILTNGFTGLSRHASSIQMGPGPASQVLVEGQRTRVTFARHYTVTSS